MTGQEKGANPSLPRTPSQKHLPLRGEEGKLDLKEYVWRVPRDMYFQEEKSVQERTVMSMAHSHAQITVYLGYPAMWTDTEQACRLI